MRKNIHLDMDAFHASFKQRGNTSPLIYLPEQEIFLPFNPSSSFIQGLPPVIADHTRVLILGTMPGNMSLGAGEYYAHPRNVFWPIMGRLYGATRALPYRQRVETLIEAGLGVWNVIASCRRRGSLDSAISDAVIQDFSVLFAHQNITHVFFNGAGPEKIFRRSVLPMLPGKSFAMKILPSTSPAHAAMSFEKKLEAWSVIKKAG